MRHDAQVTSSESFPRQKARTRGFQLGRPRGLKVVGQRVLFIRSSSGIDPAGSLWHLDLSMQPPLEECLVDAAALLTTGKLPAAELARRERMREVTSGITHFTTDKSGTVITFAISGIAYVSVLGSTVHTRELTTPGAVIDPRVSPDGQHVAFVVDGCLWVIDAHKLDAQPQLLCESTSDTETWGLADFIAAEELDRLRGYWWLADSSGLIVERTDNAPVGIRWISDPAQPANEPVAHRYPAAGEANPIVELWLIPLTGARKQLIWDLAKYPYLATVNSSDAGTVMFVLTRDQRTASINRIDITNGQLLEIAVRTDPAWIDVYGELPFFATDGALIEIVSDATTDTNRVTRDGVFNSPAGLQVNGVVDSSVEGLLVLASPDPMEQHLYQINNDGTATALTSGESWNSAVADGSTFVLATANSISPRVSFNVVHSSGVHQISSHAQTPNVTIKTNFSSVGATQLRTCVFWPTGHVPGSKKLPVIMSPYGGPHAQMVTHICGAHASDQWLADQGFAVVVVDGRGTPGRGPAWERLIKQDLAMGILADQVSALHALGNQLPDLDLDRVGIVGWSFGGYLAALAVLERPDVFHCAVAGAPVTEWRLYDTAYSERYLGDPHESPEVYDQSSLLTRAEKLQRPLLLIHGLADDNVLVAHTLQFSSALLAAGRNHSVLPLSGVTHMTPQEVVAENLLKTEVEFFRTHLQIAGPGSIGVSGPTP